MTKTCKCDKKNVSNVLFILGFLLILIIPMAKMNTKKNQVSEIDNRKLAEFPELKGGADFKKELEDFLADRIGFRKSMIGAYQRICDYLFAKLVHPLYMYGEKGYIFFNGEYIADYQHLNIDIAYIKRCGRYLADLKDYLESRNIRFLYFLIPDKKSIYREYFPRTVRVRGSRSQAEMLIEELKRLGIPFLHPLRIFLKAKRVQQIYNIKYDAGHWNEHGAFIGHSLVTERLRNHFPGIRPLRKIDYDIAMTKVNSLLVSHFAIDEAVPRYTPKHMQTQENRIYNALLDLDAYQFQLFQNQNAVGSPKLLVMRDSAFEGIERYYGSNFSEIVSVHNFENLKNIEYFINIFEPDVVLLENVERVMSPASMLFSNENMNDTVLHDYRDMNLPTIGNMAGITLAMREKTIRVKPDDVLFTITGTASWHHVGEPGRSLFVCVKGKYYAAKYPRAEDDKITSFSLTLKADTLREADQIEFVLVSADGKFKSTPMPFPVTMGK